VQPLWKVTVSTTPEAEDAIAELLASTFGKAAGSYCNVETGATIVSLYFEVRTAWSPDTQQQLSAGLKRIKACGLEIGPGTVSMRRVRREDWAESWKRHFKPLQIGAALLIRPSWSHHKAHKGQKVVVLDPGLSFGTGQHPTTHFCLKELVSRRKPGQKQSMLDLGTGSGILAIAAARLGYSPVHALEFDPDALRIARENARRNNVSQKLIFAQRDVAKLPPATPIKYSLICANLVSSLLFSERRKLVARLAPGGAIVLAGILKTEFPSVEQAYREAGLRMVKSQAQGEWRSGSFTWR
jgi:ribosomal protein L11 methyltransferase